MPGTVESVEYVVPGTQTPGDADHVLGPGHANKVTAELNAGDSGDDTGDPDNGDDAFAKALALLVREGMFTPVTKGVAYSDTSAVLRQWRRHAFQAVKRGDRPRCFNNDGLLTEVVDYVWTELAKATTKDDVRRAFSVDREV